MYTSWPPWIYLGTSAGSSAEPSRALSYWQSCRCIVSVRQCVFVTPHQAYYNRRSKRILFGWWIGKTICYLLAPTRGSFKWEVWSNDLEGHCLSSANTHPVCQGSSNTCLPHESTYQLRVYQYQPVHHSALPSLSPDISGQERLPSRNFWLLAHYRM